MLAWGPEDSNFNVLAFKIIVLLWWFGQNVNNWLFFINCHRKSGFTKFYQEMDSVYESLLSLEVESNSEETKRRRGSIIITVGVLTLTTFNIGMRIWVFTANGSMEPIFGALWRNRTESMEIYWTFKILAKFEVTLLIVQWLLYPAQYISVCYILYSMLRQFNQNFSKRVEESVPQTVAQVEAYRTVHLKLCSLVHEANRLFTVMLANATGTGLIVALILLYLLASPTETPRMAVELLTTSYWIVTNLGIPACHIYFSQRVYDEVRQLHLHI